MSQLFSLGGQSIGVSASTSVLTMKEHSGLISFRMNWLDLLAVQGTLKSLLKDQSLKASILWHLDFFMVKLSHRYMTTGKTPQFKSISSLALNFLYSPTLTSNDYWKNHSFD